MLIPFKQLYPTRLNPIGGALPVLLTQLETQLPVAPILRPRIFFKNTSSTADITVEIRHILDLGTSSDPLLTGTFPTVIVNQTVLPGELLMHHFNEVALTAPDPGVFPRWRHEIEVSNLSTTDDVIVQMWVEGWFEESLKDIPQFLPIII